jgi:hypothetical protein
MATNTSPLVPPVRRQAEQVANTLKKIINWNDVGVTNAGVQSNVAFDNSLPQGAVIFMVVAEILTAFNGGAIMTIGTVGAGYNNLLNAGDIDETVVGGTGVTRGVGTVAAEVVPYATVTQNGATQGQASITILYEGGWAS